MPTSIDVVMPQREYSVPDELQADNPFPKAAEDTELSGQQPSDQTPPPSNPSHLPVIIDKWRLKKKVLRIVLYVLLAVVLIAIPILDRRSLVKTFPGLRGLYESIGLPVAPSWDGLVFREVKSELKYDSGTMKLVVDGKIYNFTSEKLPIPDIKARALSPEGSTIQSWSVDRPAETIGPSGMVPFHTEVASPMEHTIEDVNLEFYHRDENANH